MIIKRIIPCIDFFNGRVVKGVNFKNLVDIGDPLSVAHFYNDQGADELVFLDISANLESRSNLLFYIYKISSKLSIPLTVGGGIKGLFDVKNLFNSGADKVSLNTSILNDFSIIEQIRFKYGSQSLIGALDIKRVFNLNNEFLFWSIYKSSGRKFLNLNVFDFILNFSNLGIGEFLITSIDTDGTKFGFDLSLINKLSLLTNISVICSGGIGSFNDFIDIFKINNVNAILSASILHSKKYSIFSLKSFLFNNGIKVRF